MELHAQAILERGDLPAWSVLAFCLVECRLGQASPWQPYIGMLPEASNGVLEWKESQVKPPLFASPCKQLLHQASWLCCVRMHIDFRQSGDVSRSIVSWKAHDGPPEDRTSISPGGQLVGGQPAAGGRTRHLCHTISKSYCSSSTKLMCSYDSKHFPGGDPTGRQPAAGGCAPHPQ